MTLRSNIRRALNTPCTADFGRLFGFGGHERRGRARNTFGRIQHVLLELRAGKQHTCTSLARVFETSTKSIQRDLDFLRAEGFQIVWCGRFYRLHGASNHPWFNNQLKGTR